MSNEMLLRLQAAINADTRPQDMFFQFLSSGTNEANYLANAMLNNKDVIKLVTSPKGRGWIKKWLDDFLNYLQQFGV
jgi:hypothetical protein